MKPNHPLISPTKRIAITTRTASPQAYDTDYTYDGNGNLITLHRRDDQNERIADFNYRYQTGTNKLTTLDASGTTVKYYHYKPSATEQQHLYEKVTLDDMTLKTGEVVTIQATDEIIMKPGFVIEPGATFTAELVAPDPARSPQDNYDYDAIGNLEKDYTRGITIDWTVYGKVKRINHTDGSTVDFQYDGAGNRLAKIFTSGGTTITTNYLRDASGNVTVSDYWRMAVYKDGSMAEQPIYGSSRLGQYTGANQPGKRIWSHKSYELTNHSPIVGLALGNVMAVVADGYTTIAGDKEAWITTLQDYYPPDYYRDGLEMTGRKLNTSGYTYGFNGKEGDPASEWGQTSYDYGFRIYNPGIGKFLSVDPLAKSYPMLTPYQFASNRPVDGIDLDGLEYLASDEARVHLIYGHAFIKLENFNFHYRSEFKKKYPNYGLVNIDNEGNFISGAGHLGTIFVPKPINAPFPELTNSSDPNHDETKIQPEYEDNRKGRRQRDNIRKDNKPIVTRTAIKVNPGSIKGSRGALLLVALNMGADLYVSRLVDKDITELKKQAFNWKYEVITLPWEKNRIDINVSPLRRAYVDVLIGIEIGIVPPELDNIVDLSSLVNVVLYGGEGNESDIVKEVGNRIIENISEKRKGGINDYKKEKEK